FFFPFLNEEAIRKDLEGKGDQNGRKYSEYCQRRNRPEGRMLRKDKNANSRKGGDHRKQNGFFVGNEVICPRFKLLCEAAHYKNTVVDAESENKGADDDIYNIKAESDQVHEA